MEEYKPEYLPEYLPGVVGVVFKDPVHDQFCKDFGRGYGIQFLGDGNSGDVRYGVEVGQEDFVIKTLLGEDNNRFLSGAYRIDGKFERRLNYFEKILELAELGRDHAELPKGKLEEKVLRPLRKLVNSRSERRKL